MELNVFQQKTSNLFGENRLLKLGFVVLLAVNLANWWGVQRTQQDMRTIILPVGAGGKLEIGHASASDDYLRAMSRYITQMIGNYIAVNARSQFEELLTLFAPETYGEAAKHFMSMAKEIERFPSVTSATFWDGPNALEIKQDNRVMLIHAIKTRYVNGNQTRSENVTIEIKYDIRAGHFYIISITENINA